MVPTIFLLNFICFFILSSNQGHFVMCDDLVSGIVTMDLEHSFGKTFVKRGKFVIQSFLDGRQTAEADKKGVSDSEIEEFKSLLNSNGLYRIKLTPHSRNCSSNFVTAAIPSCELMKSGFKEDIVLHLDNSNCVVGVSYSSPVIALSRPCDPSKIKSATAFHTRIKVAERILAQSIPLQALGPRPMALQHMNLGLEEVEQKGQQKPQSFLQRYWYIVVIMIVYLFIGGAKEEPKAKTREAAKKS